MSPMSPMSMATTARRGAFLAGSVAVCAGVLLHVPGYVMARHDHFMMAGMPMSGTMWLGMLAIAAGLTLAGWALTPARAQRAVRTPAPAPESRFAALDDAPLCRSHWLLVSVLFVGLVIDTMKPASLGFVAPGMAKEYGLRPAQIATLPFVGITGTVIGSLLWGRLGDVVGRRATILFSGLMYIATSICGFMPSFQWNLTMCLLMGISAGGMLPIVYSLMSESVPARHRGWLLVLQSGLATALGYLLTSGAASLLVPHLSWRVLWLIGAPTGLLLVVLTRWIPESPRFLLAHGRDEAAERVMAHYGVRETAARRLTITDRLADAGGTAPRLTALLTSPFRPRSLGIVAYGLSWGIVNWGFVTFLPVFLVASGAGTNASRLLFWSSLFALPTTALAAAMYAWWSSRRSMLVYAAATVAVLVTFAVASPQQPGRGGLLIALVSVLLSGIAGMIAMLSPYAAEVYPTTLRATGSGMAAASSKVGGMFGPLLLTSAPRIESLALVSAFPVAAAAVALWRTGPETAGRPLTEHAPAPDPVPVVDQVDQEA